MGVGWGGDAVPQYANQETEQNLEPKSYFYQFLYIFMVRKLPAIVPDIIKNVWEGAALQHSAHARGRGLYMCVHPARVVCTVGT